MQPVNANDIEMLAGGKRRRRGFSSWRLWSDAFPYLLVPVLIYNLMALFAGASAADGSPGLARVIDAVALSVPMLSSVRLNITWGELMLIFSVVFLFVEVIKSTNTASLSIVNHILSMLLFVVCLMEFLMFANFATGTFLIITAMVLVDALAGMVVTIISARRDFGVEGIGA
ncbi:hypothetical protein [Aurantiacibacter flavus]|uniref:Transmembrane protein n=1 Tax=Aurantiacibacter flavus TaxID=3145232 RepID=A0ABV0CS30_9SPHN